MEGKLPKRHIILIGGFTQTTRTVTGLVSLFYKLWTLAKGRGILLWTPLSWHIDIPATVEMIRNSGMDAEVVIIAYSYGGEKARRLVRALNEKGIKVRFLFLIDPVRRWPIPGLAAALGWFGWFRALTPIEIPGNVVEAWHYSQRRSWKSWPYGWPVAPRFPGATRLTSTQLSCGHVDADDSPVVHAHVLRAILSWIRETETNAAPVAPEPEASPVTG